MIGIDRAWKAVALDISPHAGKDTFGAFRVCKMEVVATGGIINHDEQTARRSSSFKPVMDTAIELDQFTDPGASLSFSSMASP